MGRQYKPKKVREAVAATDSKRTSCPNRTPDNFEIWSFRTWPRVEALDEEEGQKKVEEMRKVHDDEYNQ